MNVLSQTTGYAIEALACLAASSSKSMMVREIAAETGIAQAYLAKVVQRLVVAGVVDSKRGYRGGIYLSRSPSDITIKEIDDAVEINRPPDRCLLGMTSCSEERACPAHDYWKETRESVRHRLTTLTLDDIVAFEIGRKAGDSGSSPLGAG